MLNCSNRAKCGKSSRYLSYELRLQRWKFVILCGRTLWQATEDHEMLTSWPWEITPFWFQFCCHHTIYVISHTHSRPSLLALTTAVSSGLLPCSSASEITVCVSKCKKHKLWHTDTFFKYLFHCNGHVISVQGHTSLIFKQFDIQFCSIRNEIIWG